MAEDFNLDAKFTADTAQFHAQIQKLITDLAKYNEKVNYANKATIGFEKVLAKAGGAAATAARSQSTFTKSIDDTNSSIIRQRYALYDVASTYGVVSAALLAVSAVSVKTAADFESAFTNVERTFEDGTTPAAIREIRSELVDLSTTIPKTFDDITKVATLGNQLGIEASNIAGFTETISRFSAVSGVGTEETATSFGKLANLTGLAADKFENLGSSIAYVARTSAATDAAILSTSKEIAAISDGAGFSAQAIVGLSGALASLSIAPEKARGALSTYFGTLNSAVAEGGTKLQNFATVTGLTADELTRLVGAGQGQQVFQRFIAGLKDLDSVAKTTALDELGLGGIRTDQTFQALSGSVGLVTKSFKDAESSFQSGTELARQFALINDDLNSKFQELVNSVNALIEELSGGLVPGLSGAVAGLIQFVSLLRDMAKNPAVKVIAGLAVVLTTLIGVLFAYRAVVALTIASTYAMTTAFGTASAASVALSGSAGLGAVSGILKLLVPGMYAYIVSLRATVASTLATTTATVASSVAMGTMSAATGVATNAFRVMLLALGPIGIALAAVGLAGSFLVPLAQDSIIAAGALKDLRDELAAGQDVANSQLIQGVVQADNLIKGLTSTADQYVGVSRAFVDALNAPGIEQATAEIAAYDQQLASVVQSGNAEAIAEIQFRIAAAGIDAANSLPLYTQALQSAQLTALDATVAFIAAANAVSLVSASTPKAASNVAKLGGSAGGAAKKVRTLVDYANDLSSVFGRAFDIRFGSQSAIDEVTSSFQDLADRIRDAQTELLKLTADKNVKEYFLSVANAYGDTLRAGILTGEIADINAKIAETQADASTELTGNSAAAIKNRKTITNLVQEYADYITSLAESGASQETLNAAVAQSKADFIAQATALGYSNAQLQPYIASFGDMSKVIAKVPRNITVGFNGDPALQAINEFMAKARSALSSGVGALNLDSLEKSLRRAALDAQLAGLYRALAVAGINGTAKSAIESQIFRIKSLIASGSYASGGYTGPGGKYQPAGVVHKGEYVVPKEQVNQRTGLPYATALGGVAAGSRGNQQSGYAGGGLVGGGLGVMELGPRSLRTIEAISRQTVYAVLAESPTSMAQYVRTGNKQLQGTGVG